MTRINELAYGCTCGDTLLTVSDRCRGSLKCLTYAITGNYKLKDVGCDL